MARRLSKLMELIVAEAWLPHDLLQISGAADLVYLEQCPPWVGGSLRRAPLVVVRRAESVDHMIPVGVRGSLRNQRFAACLAPESVLGRIVPEQLAGGQGWPASVRSRKLPALKALAAIETKLANFSLAYGPTGSIGFELACGLATATSASDLDLLVRVPERLSIIVARDLMTSLSEGPCHIDVQLETPHGAISLDEYARGEKPLLLKQCRGPALVSDPWAAPGFACPK